MITEMFTDENKKDTMQGFLPLVHHWTQSLYSLYSPRGKQAVFASLALGQEVIKQDQKPGTAHGPAIWTA